MIAYAILCCAVFAPGLNVVGILLHRGRAYGGERGEGDGRACEPSSVLQGCALHLVLSAACLGPGVAIRRGTPIRPREMSKAQVHNTHTMHQPCTDNKFDEMLCEARL